MTAARSVSVLFVCQGDFSGPSEKQMLGFAQQLAGRGHRVLFSLGGPSESLGMEGLALRDGIELHEHGFAGSRLRASDRAAVAAFRPTLIHAVNPRRPTAAAASDYEGVTGAPLFVHFEDDEWSAWRGVPGESVYYRFGRRVRRLESVVHPTSWPHSTAATRRWARRHATALDALTPELASAVKQRFRRPCAVLLPVSPLVKPSSPTEVDLPRTLTEMPLAMVTGTIYPFSLGDTLQALRAVARLQRRGYEIAYVHPGNVHPRIDPSALAVQAGLQPGTFAFPGQLPYSQIGTLLSRATVLLQPGAPSEFNRLRLPSKLQSYLESGRPTITFAVGFGKMLEDRIEVLKIHTDAPEELAERIREVFDDAELRATLSDGGPRAARRLFNPERNTDALLAHYVASLPS